MTINPLYLYIYIEAPINPLFSMSVPGNFLREPCESQHPMVAKDAVGLARQGAGGANERTTGCQFLPQGDVMGYHGKDRFLKGFCSGFIGISSFS